MPDPIQSTYTRPLPDTFTCHDPDTSPKPLAPDAMCAEPTSGEASPAVLELVKSYSTPPSKPPPLAANTAAERAHETPIELGYARAGTTRDGSAYSGAALLYGQAGHSGVTLEALSVASQRGVQTEAALTAARATWTNAAGDTLSAELFSAQSFDGAHNKDGSTGLNAGAGGVIVASEATLSLAGSSVTLGASLGATLEASLGTRDQDGDGATEYCARVSIPGVPLSGGVCVEEPAGWGH